MTSLEVNTVEPSDPEERTVFISPGNPKSRDALEEVKE